MSIKCLIIQLLLKSALSLDFTYIPYCKMKCVKPGQVPLIEHVACNCTLLPGREIITKDVDKFREEVVKLHNKWRNKVASGKQAKFQSATNMEVLNYDFEMEYIATCVAKKFSEVLGKPCTMPTTSSRYVTLKAPGRSMTEYGDPTKTALALMEREWFNQSYTLAKDESGSTVDLSKYNKKHYETGFAFIHLMWFDLKYVGCARVWYPDNSQSWARYVAICIYGGSHWANSGFSDVGYYTAGTACSRCPYLVKCNKVYKSLCGEIKSLKAIEEETADKIENAIKKPGKASTGAKSKLIMIIVIIVYCL